MRGDMRKKKRGETNACEEKQTADSFGVFEDISKLSIKLFRGSKRRMHSSSSAVIVPALPFSWRDYASSENYASRSQLPLNVQVSGKNNTFIN